MKKSLSFLVLFILFMPVLASLLYTIHVPTIKGLREGTSSVWAGYAVLTSISSPEEGVVSDVKGSWTVPTVDCTVTPNAYASFWIGIDGYYSGTVEQIGTESDCSSGSARYYTWYEMYPRYAVELNVQISPGDTASAEVQYLGGGSFNLTITNVSTATSFSTTQKSTSAARSSAEWIAEAPSSISGRVTHTLPLADFGTVTFQGAQATLSGHEGTISDGAWQYDRIDTSPSSGSYKAVTSALATDGASFSVEWHSTTATLTTTSATSSTSTTSTMTSQPTTTSTESSITTSVTDQTTTHQQTTTSTSQQTGGESTTISQQQQATTSTSQQPPTTTTTNSTSIFIAEHVVINEFEQNPPGDDRVGEFVELYNPTGQAVDISGWIFFTTHGDIESYTIPAGTVLPTGGFWIVKFQTQFLDNEDESIVLINALGQPVDHTSMESDTADDSCSWQRYPDGSDNWIFALSTTSILNAPEFSWPTLIVLTLVSLFASSRPLASIARLSTRNLRRVKQYPLLE